MEIIYQSPLKLGEGPVWDERLNTLFFVDILSKKFYKWNYIDQLTAAFTFDEYVSCIALTENENIIHIALESGIYAFDLKTKEKTFITQPEQLPNYRYNDGQVDAYGNWLLGSMNNINNGAEATLQPDATLYKISGTHSSPLLTGVTISNGIVFRGTDLFFIDSKLNTVRQFTYDGQTLTFVAEIFALSDGTTLDGMTISEDEKLYIANWGGAQLIVFDLKTKMVTDKIPLPALNPTSCTFGGPQMNELFITTSQIDDPNPKLAGLYRIKLQDRGFVENKLK